MIKANRKPLFFLLAAVVLIAAGFFRGETMTVFRKASAICMECIGIG